MRGACSLFLLLGCVGAPAPGPAAIPAPAPGPAPAPAAASAPPTGPTGIPEPPPADPEPPRAPVPPRDAAPPAAESAPPEAARARPSSQAAIAAGLNEEARKAIAGKGFAQASEKLRSAVARVPEPRYFFNLCLSLYLEGKLDEGMRACKAVHQNEPPPALRDKTNELIQRVRDEARRQGIWID
jgi:hypothetical protein